QLPPTRREGILAGLQEVDVVAGRSGRLPSRIQSSWGRIRLDSRLVSCQVPSRPRTSSTSSSTVMPLSSAARSRARTCFTVRNHSRCLSRIVVSLRLEFLHAKLEYRATWPSMVRAPPPFVRGELLKLTGVRDVPLLDHARNPHRLLLSESMKLLTR